MANGKIRLLPGKIRLLPDKIRLPKFLKFMKLMKSTAIVYLIAPIIELGEWTSQVS